MIKQYSCNLCKKIFNQKNELLLHKDKCVPNVNDKNTLIVVFKNCLNILRDNEGLTGEKALRNLSYFLILKLIEPHFGNEINIDEYKYVFSYIEDELIEAHTKKIIRNSSL